MSYLLYFYMLKQYVVNHLLQSAHVRLTLSGSEIGGTQNYSLDNSPIYKIKIYTKFEEYNLNAHYCQEENLKKL